METALDHLRPAVDRDERGLEGRRLLARRCARMAMHAGDLQQQLSGRLVAGAGRVDDQPDDLAIAVGPDRQAMIVVPRREAALLGVVPERDLAVLQHLPVGTPKDRQQEAAAVAVLAR